MSGMNDSSPAPCSIVLTVAESDVLKDAIDLWIETGGQGGDSYAIGLAARDKLDQAFQSNASLEPLARK